MRTLAHYLPMMICLACGAHGVCMVRFLLASDGEHKSLGVTVSFSVLAFLTSLATVIELGVVR